MTVAITIRRLPPPVAEPVIAAPRVLESDIHVWTATVGDSDPQAWLTPDERERRDRLGQATDRSRFVAGRALARRVLAHYLDCAPHIIEFVIDEHGKPCLANARKPCFNLSHAGNCVACVVAEEACGIDVEPVRAFPQCEAVAQGILDDSARATWQTLDCSEGLDFLFAQWTLCEAWSKAHGRGLASGVEPVRFGDSRDRHGCRWQPLPGYWLAVVATGPVRCFGHVRWFAELDLIDR